MAYEGRTEKATPKKREDERKKGNIFQSREVVTVFTLAAIALLLKAIAPLYFDYIKQTVHYYFGRAPEDSVLTINETRTIFNDVLIRVLILTLPLAVVASVSAVLATFAQTRMNISREPIKFKISRVSIINGFRGLFSVKSAVELVKSIIKVSVISYILYQKISSNINTILKMIGSDILEAVYWIAGTVISIILNICVVLFVFSIFDYLYQWWEYERRIRMTRQEVKDEYKQSEGDPLVRGRIRERQRSIANIRMMARVPTADFVVTNPTHYAVAIKYDPDSESHKAPVVVAKGRGYVALKIISIAEENRVTVTQNPVLARALYKSVRVGGEIPPKFYQAVAEILAFVYNLRKRDRLYEIKK
jgi:flagellar biosynthetic protein FlhB